MSLQPPRSSVIIPTHNEGPNLHRTVLAILENSGPDLREVVVVDDGSTDDSISLLVQGLRCDRRLQIESGRNLGVAGARNRGAGVARGEILIFLDAHCHTPRGWMKPLIGPFRDEEVGAVAPAIASLRNPLGAWGFGVTWCDASLSTTWLRRAGDEPYGVPLLCGACQAVRRSTFEEVGGYESGMGRWGSEDHEFSLRMWLLGYSVLIQPQSVIYHLFRDHAHYRVEWEQVLYNLFRMAALHFRPDRLERVMDHYRTRPGFVPALRRLVSSDVEDRRQTLIACRRRTDDWFFNSFGIPI